MPRLVVCLRRCLMATLVVALSGCASLDKYSFETFGKPKQPEAVHGDRPRSDRLALVYSDYVAKLLEGRATGSRVTRELTDSTLVVGGALTGAQGTLGLAASTVAGMGVGAVILHELQGVFNARGRSEAFADAAYLIRQAQSEFRQYNPNPTDGELSENGAILVSRVDAALYAARKTLNGRMPGLIDLQQATQPMTREGATRFGSGRPRTIFTASGEKPNSTTTESAANSVATERLEAALIKNLQAMKREAAGQGGRVIVQPIKQTELQRRTRVSTRALKDVPETEIPAVYKAIYGDKVPPPDVSKRDTIFNELIDLGKVKPGGDVNASPEDLKKLESIEAAIGR